MDTNKKPDNDELKKAEVDPHSETLSDTDAEKVSGGLIALLRN